MIFSLRRIREKMAACILSFLCLWGCSLKYGGQISRPFPLSAEKVFYRLLEQRDSFHDVRGKASVTLMGQGRKQRFRAHLVFDSSRRIRIEGLGFADTPYFFLIADSNQICFYAPDQQKILSGRSSEDTLFQLTGIRLEIGTLIALFSGNLPPRLSPSTLERVSVNEKGGFLEFPSDHQDWCRLWIDRNKGVMEKLEVYDLDKKLLFTARFGDYETIGSYNWPKRIECDFVFPEVYLKINYKRFFLNSGVDESLFRLQYPPGTVIEYIG